MRQGAGGQWPNQLDRRAVLLAIAVGLLNACASSPIEKADVPLSAQVVDAESRQPLAGVVVLAYWMKSIATFGGWAGTELYDSEEAVTGADGRFAVRPRFTYTVPGMTKITGPEVVIFKPGYGRWRYRSDRGKEPTIELPRLRTREERLKFYDSLSWSAPVPEEKRPRLLQALRVERRYLGFQD